MKIEEYKGKIIFDSDSHGSSCKGAKKTTGMQVRENVPGGYLLLKTFNYPVGNIEARNKVIAKCRAYIDEDFN